MPPTSFVTPIWSRAGSFSSAARRCCGYDAPNDPFVEAILEQNIKGERCAIGFYKKLLEATQGKDPVTYNIVLQILQDEVAHEEDLQSLAEDLDFMLKKSR
jgi:bacterioferritin